jgi:hypothetical protein
MSRRGDCLATKEAKYNAGGARVHGERRVIASRQ